MSNLFLSEKATRVINLFCQEIKNHGLSDWHPIITIYENDIGIRIYRNYRQITRTLKISKKEIEINCLDPISLSLFYLGQFKKSFKEEYITYFDLKYNKNFNYSESFDKFLKDNGYYGE